MVLPEGGGGIPAQRNRSLYPGLYHLNGRNEKQGLVPLPFVHPLRKNGIKEMRIQQRLRLVHDKFPDRTDNLFSHPDC